MVRAIYPGSFDPMTLGHYDIVHRASKLFDEVIMAVVGNPGKSPPGKVGKGVLLSKR